MPSFRHILFTGFILAMLGWGGLFLLFVLTVPNLGPRWLLFFLATLAVAGPALPAVAYLHRRFPSEPPAGAPVLLREAILFGVYADLILWLQLGRVLTFALAMFIAIGLVAVEALLRWRERSRWSPRRHECE